MSGNLFPKEFDFKDSYPKLNRRLRLGVVGGGRISATQAMAARMTGLWEIVAGALSSDPVRSRERGKEWLISPERSYSSFKEMAKMESSLVDGVDAVMITTPNNLHFPASKAFLDTGINVICDKPLTNTVNEAQQLEVLADKSGCVFGVGYVMSCFPMIRQAREIVAKGGLGNINQIHVEFLQDWMIPENVVEASHVKWRLDPEITG